GRCRHHLLQSLWPQPLGRRTDWQRGDAHAHSRGHGERRRGGPDHSQRPLVGWPARRGDADHERALSGVIRGKVSSRRRGRFDGAIPEGRVGTMSPPARTCAIAFKEWAGVCDALIQGRQTIIVRKGGISEGAGPGSFVPEHAEFWIYPTWVHQG